MDQRGRCKVGFSISPLPIISGLAAFAGGQGCAILAAAVGHPSQAPMVRTEMPSVNLRHLRPLPCLATIKPRPPREAWGGVLRLGTRSDVPFPRLSQSEPG